MYTIWNYFLHLRVQTVKGSYNPCFSDTSIFQKKKLASHRMHLHPVPHIIAIKGTIHVDRINALSALSFFYLTTSLCIIKRCLRQVPILTPGTCLNRFGRGLLDNATQQISNFQAYGIQFSFLTIFKHNHPRNIYLVWVEINSGDHAFFHLSAKNWIIWDSIQTIYIERQILQTVVNLMKIKLLYKAEIPIIRESIRDVK